MLDHYGTSGMWSVDSPAEIASLSGEIGRQAAMIGYVNAFYLYGWTGVSIRITEG